MATHSTSEATALPSTGLSAEQLADIEAARAEMATPEHKAEMARVRALIEDEFPPARPGPEWAEGMARLRLTREARGLSLDDVAERSGIDRMAISRIERGMGNPTFATIGRLAAAVGVRPVLEFEDATG